MAIDLDMKCSIVDKASSLYNQFAKAAFFIYAFVFVELRRLFLANALGLQCSNAWSPKILNTMYACNSEF